MAKNQGSKISLALLRVARVHFVYIGLLATQIVVYDSWKLITPDNVLKRWLAVAGLFIVNLFVWYMARTRKLTSSLYHILTFVLIGANIAFASCYVYLQRGMASRAVLLYIVPLLVSAILLSRAAIFATASAIVASYSATAIAYFVLNFNEGYKIELYGEVIFYSAMIYISAALLWIFIREKNS